MEGRNLELVVRKEKTRDKFHTEVVRFELDQIKSHFTETVQAINAQFNIADELIESGKVSEGENIWRAQILFLASALDFYMHEFTKYGLCEIYNENWVRTSKYDKIQVSMKEVEIALKYGENIDWFLEYINGYYHTMTMVSFDAVEDQLKLLGINVSNIADKAFYQRGATEKTKHKMKRRLNELFSRRNIIVHQTDRAHTNAEVNSITKKIVEDFIYDITKIVDAIYEEAGMM